MNKQSEILFATQLEESLNDETFVKLSMGNYKGGEEGLKQLYVKPVIIKNKKKNFNVIRSIMETPFKNKVAIVTGGSFGIGQVTALAFAKKGVKNVLTKSTHTANNAVVEKFLFITKFF